MFTELHHFDHCSLIPMLVLRGLLCIAFLTAPLLTHAQPIDPEFSAGPIFSLTGLGIGATAKVVPQFSVSGEFTTAFVSPPIDLGDFEEVDYDVDLSIWSFSLMGHVHPLGGSFAIGAGLYIGGYGLEGTGVANEEITIGDNTYQAAELGEAVAEFRLGGPTPVFEIGRRGKGFNVGIGVIVPINTKVDLTFPDNTVPNQAQFEADLEAEISEVRDELRFIPLLPFFRIGYQFGVN